MVEGVDQTTRCGAVMQRRGHERAETGGRGKAGTYAWAWAICDGTKPSWLTCTAGECTAAACRRSTVSSLPASVLAPDKT